MNTTAIVTIYCTNALHEPKKAFVDHVGRDSDGRWRTTETTWTTDSGETLRSRKSMTYIDEADEVSGSQVPTYGGGRVFERLSDRRVFRFDCPLGLANRKLHCPTVEVRGEGLDVILDPWIEMTRDTPLAAWISLGVLAARVASKQ